VNQPDSVTQPLCSDVRTHIAGDSDVQQQESRAYWPVLGLVLGPGCVLGVGLVVLGVSVPMPPALEPELDAPPEVSPGMPDDELPEVDAPPEVPDEDAPPEVPDEESDGMPDEVPPVLLPLVPEGDVEEVPEVPLVPDVPPELIPEPLPEPPPVMPVHAPSSIAHAMGNIHFVI